MVVLSSFLTVCEASFFSLIMSLFKGTLHRGEYIFQQVV